MKQNVMELARYQHDRGMSVRALESKFGLPVGVVAESEVATLRRQNEWLRERVTRLEQMLGLTPARNECERLARPIIAIVAEETGISYAQIMSRSRKAPIALARMLAMTVVKGHHPALSYVGIGLVFDRDHTTVMHAVETTTSRLMRDHDLADAWKRIMARLADGEAR